MEKLAALLMQWVVTVPEKSAVGEDRDDGGTDKCDADTTALPRNAHAYIWVDPVSCVE